VNEEPVHTQEDPATDAQIITEHTNSSNASASNSNLDQGRIRKPPSWHADYDTSINEDDIIDEESMNLIAFGPCVQEDPVKYEEAEKSQKWRDAMKSEIDSIERNKTWELTDLPKGVRVIGVKWIYKTKLNEKGEIEKFKARLVAKGYAQKYGTDYKEVFAPVARWDTIRCLLAIAAMKGWIVHQLDVKSAFLHRELNETVYVEQPLGYIKKGSENKVYRLHKALYGLKQAPRAWYSKIETYFTLEQFEKCSHEHTLFVKYGSNSKILIVSLYVDDLICTGNDVHMIYGFKESMKK
jgi:hypothetical protein